MGAQGQGAPRAGGEGSPGHALQLSTVRADLGLLFLLFWQLVSLSHHLLAAAVSGDTKQPLLAAGSGWGGLQVFQEALAWGCFQSWLLARFLCCLQNTDTTALLCLALRAGKGSALSLPGSKPSAGSCNPGVQGDLTALSNCCDVGHIFDFSLSLHMQWASPFL